MIAEIDLRYTLQQLAREYHCRHISLGYRSIYRFDNNPKDYGWKRGQMDESGKLVDVNGQIVWYRCSGLPMSAEVV